MNLSRDTESKLKEEGLSLTRYKFENYIAELWYRSDTKMALLSGAPGRSNLVVIRK